MDNLHYGLSYSSSSILDMNWFETNSFTSYFRIGVMIFCHGNGSFAPNNIEEVWDKWLDMVHIGWFYVLFWLVYWHDYKRKWDFASVWLRKLIACLQLIIKSGYHQLRRCCTFGRPLMICKSIILPNCCNTFRQCINCNITKNVNDLSILLHYVEEQIIIAA